MTFTDARKQASVNVFLYRCIIISIVNKEVVVRKFRTTTQHGALEGKTQSKEVKYYNLS